MLSAPSKIKDPAPVISHFLQQVLQNQPTQSRQESYLICQNSSWLTVTHQASAAQVVSQLHPALSFQLKELFKRLTIPTLASKANATAKTLNLFSNSNTLEVNKSNNRRILSRMLSDRVLLALTSESQMIHSGTTAKVFCQQLFARRTNLTTLC